MSGYDQNYGGLDPTWQDEGPSGDSYGQNRNWGSSYDAPEEGTVILRPNRKPTFAWLVVVKGARPGQLYQLTEDKRGLRIGRSGKCNIALGQDGSVSTEHAQVYREGEHWVIHDLASANGTFLNGEQIYHQKLEENDRITIGETVLVFKQIKESDLNG